MHMCVSQSNGLFLAHVTSIDHGIYIALSYYIFQQAHASLCGDMELFMFYACAEEVVINNHGVTILLIALRQWHT